MNESKYIDVIDVVDHVQPDQPDLNDAFTLVVCLTFLIF